jgi:hypothetical protein
VEAKKGGRRRIAGSADAVQTCFLKKGENMSRTKIRRRAASTKGFLRRLKDGGFDKVEDPREQNRITHRLEPVLNLAVLSLVTAARSTRAVEERSEGLKAQVKRAIGLAETISDNAFGLLMARLEPNDLRKVVRSQIKAEWKRKNLRPTVLPWSTVAIDGKHVATITEQRLRALISQTTPFDGDYETARQVFRIERVAATDDKTSVGNRYFVGSMSADQMSAEQAYMLARSSRINPCPLALRERRPLDRGRHLERGRHQNAVDDPSTGRACGGAFACGRHQHPGRVARHEPHKARR